MPYALAGHFEELITDKETKAWDMRIMVEVFVTHMWAITMIKLTGPAEKKASVSASLGVLLEACWAGAVGTALAGKQLLCLLIAEAAGV